MTQIKPHTVRREERTFDILVPGVVGPVLVTWTRYEGDSWRFGQVSTSERRYVWRDIEPDGVAPQWLKDIALALHPVDTRDRKLYLALDDVNALLREAGIEYPTGLPGLRDLVNQRDGHLQALREEQEKGLGAHRPCMETAWAEGYDAGDRDSARHHRQTFGYTVTEGPDVTVNPYVKES